MGLIKKTVCSTLLQLHFLILNSTHGGKFYLHKFPFSAIFNITDSNYYNKGQSLTVSNDDIWNRKNENLIH